MSPAFVLRGAAIGLAIAAPVGPIGLLCINRTLTKGRLSGFLSGLGAATADGCYAAIAGFGLTALAGALTTWATPVRLLGGACLVYFGVAALRARPAAVTPEVTPLSLFGDYASTFGLTLTNPLTILSFAAVFANVGIVGPQADAGEALLLVLGVFLGSALWWWTLSSVVSKLRAAGRAEFWRPVSCVVGVALAAFGVAVWVGWALGR